MPPIRVLIADDHPVVLHGLRALLGGSPDLVEVVGDARAGDEAVRKAVELYPDVAILDLQMPEKSGIQALEEIRRQSPSTRTLVLSMHKSSDYVRSAFAAGAAGFLAKDSELADLVQVVCGIHAGETHLSPTISRLVLEEYLRRSGEDPSTSVLTPRESEVLQLIATEKASKEIASLLGISLRTVDAHRSSIMKKLDIHTLAGLVRYAVRAGLV